MDRNRKTFETPRSPSRSTRNNLELPRISDSGGSMPSTSPRRRNKTNIFSDRYIPNRTGVDLQAAFSLSNQEIFPDLRSGRGSSGSGASRSQINGGALSSGVDNEIEIRKEEEANKTFLTILKAELFGDNVPLVVNQASNGGGGSGSGSGGGGGGSHSGNGRPMLAIGRSSTGGGSSSGSGGNSGRTTPPRSTRGSGSGIGAGTGSSSNGAGGIGGSISVAAAAQAATVAAAVATSGSNSALDITATPRHSSNLFTFQSPSKSRPISRDLQSELYSLSPVRQDSQKLLLSPQKKPRNISKVPYRVLDAPELSDDFYLNLVDWGSQDILAVGLGDSVYLWDGATQSVDRLCNLSNKDKVTSINWIGLGTHLAIGTLKGLVEIWDATKMKCIRTMSGHNLRVSSLAWNEHILSSGSRDRSILNRDVRVAEHFVNRFDHHKQEVCGLKWNVEENKLASGGNDNNLFIWDGLNPKPLHLFRDHTAAVKAISWSPHQRGILASGGGTADKTIKTWNTLTGTMLHNVNTGSQVCNLAWSKNSNELVSTHGYSRNQVVVWKYPSMQQIALLTGHTYRVLYLSLSPDGETIVTGAGDETLRFWNVFEKNKNDEPPSSVLLDAFLQLR